MRGKMDQRRATSQPHVLDSRKVEKSPFIRRISLRRTAAGEMADAPAFSARGRREMATDKARTAGQGQQGSSAAHRTASMRSCGTNISSR